jgi:integrase
MTTFSKTLRGYLEKKRANTLFAVLRSYYTENSPFLIIDTARGRKMNETSRQILHGFIINTFIPFLQKNKIRRFSSIKPVVMRNFQNYLLIEKKMLPQSINRQMGGIKAIFSHLFMAGVIKHNIVKDISPLRPANSKIRGCYSIDELKGIFKYTWEEKKSYLLCSIIYSTGIRNSELQNLKVKDLSIRENVNFLNIVKSKTSSGIRIIPLHPKVRKTLDEWINENKLSGEDYLFVKSCDKRIFKNAKKAAIFMGSLLGKGQNELKNENITFYSGRHFYKTMLNLYNMGDVEELFMGHKVSKNVSERYNHKDKRGEKELLAAAKKAIEIIDNSLFQ